MKKTIIGIVFLILGVYLVDRSHNYAYQLMPSLASWSARVGRYWTAVLRSRVWVFYLLGILFAVFGIFVLIREFILELKSENLK